MSCRKPTRMAPQPDLCNSVCTAKLQTFSHSRNFDLNYDMIFTQELTLDVLDTAF